MARAAARGQHRDHQHDRQHDHQHDRQHDPHRPAAPAERRRTAGDVLRTAGRLALGGALLFAGTSHLTFAREEFTAQVPESIPLPEDPVVLASGVAEIALGAAIAVAPRRFRPAVGWLGAAFFVAVFPGNVSQYLTGTDAFGLDSDAKRLVRLPFQGVLVAWSLWSTGAWRAWRGRRRG